MSPTLVTQSRIASLIASLSVRLPASTRIDVGPEQAHAEDVERLTVHVLGAHVHVAFAGRAARMRSRWPRRADPRRSRRRCAACPCATASSAWPSALLILCAPVWARSSRFRKMRAPPNAADSRRRLGQRRGTSHVVLQQPIELLVKLRVLGAAEVRALELLDRLDERLGHVAARQTPRNSRGRRDRAVDAFMVAHIASKSASRRSRSFTPGADSTPDDTSMPKRPHLGDRRGHVLGREASREQQPSRARQRRGRQPIDPACRCRPGGRDRVRRRAPITSSATPPRERSAAQRTTALMTGRVICAANDGVSSPCSCTACRPHEADTSLHLIRRLIHEHADRVNRCRAVSR